MSAPDYPGLDTLALHAGSQPDPATGARATPIYQSASFCFPDSDYAASLFNIERAGHVYSRLSNPTNAVLEERIAALEDGVGAIATASGQAALTLAIMTLPVVIVSTRETLQAVPQSFRMACWSLGATRWQTIRKVVLPNSVSGILTGVILEVSRTVGETAPVMFTGAVLFTPFLPQGVLDETMAMSLHLYMIATVIPDVPPEVPYGVALSLILMVLVLNSASIGFRVYLRGKKKW